MRHEPRNDADEASKLEQLISQYLFELESYRRRLRVSRDNGTTAEEGAARSVLEAERELREWIGRPFLEHAPDPETGDAAPELDL